MRKVPFPPTGLNEQNLPVNPPLNPPLNPLLNLPVNPPLNLPLNLRLNLLKAFWFKGHSLVCPTLPPSSKAGLEGVHLWAAQQVHLCQRIDRGQLHKLLCMVA